MEKQSTKALNLAEKKCKREQRVIEVHREDRGGPDDVYYVTPKQKVTERFDDLYEKVETFEPEPTGDSDSRHKTRIEDFSDLENGDRVVVNNDDVHTITEVTSRQIITNFGEKFRKSDGVEWGGGDNQITHQLK